MGDCKLYAGLIRRHFLLEDWESVQGMYDGIVSVMPAVGLAMLDCKDWGELVRGEWRD